MPEQAGRDIGVREEPCADLRKFQLSGRSAVYPAAGQLLQTAVQSATGLRHRK